MLKSDTGFPEDGCDLTDSQVFELYRNLNQSSQLWSSTETSYTSRSTDVSGTQFSGYLPYEYGMEDEYYNYGEESYYPESDHEEFDYELGRSDSASTRQRRKRFGIEDTKTGEGFRRIHSQKSLSHVRSSSRRLYSQKSLSRVTSSSRRLRSQKSLSRHRIRKHRSRKSGSDIESEEEKEKSDDVKSRATSILPDYRSVCPTCSIASKSVRSYPTYY